MNTNKIFSNQKQAESGQNKVVHSHHTNNKKTKVMSKTKTTTVGKEAGKGSKGRPVVENSARQMRLAARAARVAAGGEVKRGRPAVETSARQAKLAAQAAKIAAGESIKRGRPKAEKVATEVAAEA
jgi:hypothetical protein